MTSALEVLSLAVLHGTAVAAAAWGLDFVLRGRVSPAFSSAVWTIALLKFFLPWGPAFRFSLSSAVARGAGSLTLGPSVITAGASSGPGGPGWGSAFLAGYALIALGLGLKRLIRFSRLSKSVAALPEAPSAVMEAVRQAASALGLRALPRVRLGGGPFIIGCLRPTLVLPDGGLTGEEGNAVLLHELAHLRRRDHWVRLLQALAGIVFFFWPPVGWVNRKLEAFRELACDQVALSAGALSVTSYARVLLAAQRGAVQIPVEFAVLEMASRSSRLERRIDLVLKLKRGRSMRFGLVGLAGWAALVLSGSSFAGDADAGSGSAAPARSGAGSLERSMIQEAVRAHLAQVTSCYEVASAADPRVAGKLVLGWKVAADGAAEDVQVISADYEARSSSASGAQLQRCVASAVASWRFPRPFGGTVEVVYPFSFTAKSVATP